MDKKDKQILDALVADSSRSVRELSKLTHIPITTVHHRIRKLRDEGIIKRFTIEVDAKKMGKRFFAIIMVSCDYRLLRELKKDQHQLAREIRLMPEVEQVSVVTGGVDMFVQVRVCDVEEFDKFLLTKFQKIAGVDKTQSLIVIHEG